MTVQLVVGAALVGLGLVHLLYTYVGYPFIISLLPARPARPARPSLPGALVSPRLVSVVIAARSGEQGITSKVKNLLRTIRLPCEIVVVLDGPDADVTAELRAVNDDRVKIAIVEGRLGKAASLNRGVATSAGDTLVFTDVRQDVAAGAVERLVEDLDSPDVGAVSGSLAISTASDSEGLYERYWRFERWLRMREAAWDSTVGVSGALYALKRELWRPLPQGLLLDDVWVPFQVVGAGKRVAFAPRAVVTDIRSRSDATELARKVRTLTGNYQLIAWMPSLLHPGKNRMWWQFISHKVLRLLTPFAVACCVAGGLLLLSGRWALIVGSLVGLGLALALVPNRGRAAGPPGTGVLGTARSALALFAALIVAALNAARGRWDVWADPARPTFVDPRQS